MANNRVSLFSDKIAEFAVDSARVYKTIDGQIRRSLHRSSSNFLQRASMSSITYVSNGYEPELVCVVQIAVYCAHLFDVKTFDLLVSGTSMESPKRRTASSKSSDHCWSNS